MKKYKEFLPGDEVQTRKDNYSAITANKPYIVLACYRPIEMINNCTMRVIDIMTDKGFISRYSTNTFTKTETQIRDDKLKSILN